MHSRKQYHPGLRQAIWRSGNPTLFAELVPRSTRYEWARTAPPKLVGAELFDEPSNAALLAKAQQRNAVVVALVVLLSALVRATGARLGRDGPRLHFLAVGLRPR